MATTKVALITASSAGLGAQIARVFAPDFRVVSCPPVQLPKCNCETSQDIADQRAQVINYSSNSERAQNLIKELNAIPSTTSSSEPRFHLVQADMSSKPSVDNLVKETLDKFGRIDVVV